MVYYENRAPLARGIQFTRVKVLTGLVLAVFVLVTVRLLYPIISSSFAAQRNARQQQLVSDFFASVRVKNDTALLTPRRNQEAFLYLNPDAQFLALKPGGSFQLTDRRRWSHIFTVRDIGPQDIVLSYREAGRGQKEMGEFKLEVK